MADVESLVVRTPATFAADYSIDVRLGHEVVGVDVDGGTLRVVERDGGRERVEPFDDLVVATGAVPVRPPLAGADAAGVFGVHTLDDGVALRSFLACERPARAVIVGGGYVGLEMAEALRALGVETHLVDAADQPLGSLDPDMGALVAAGLHELGVVLHLGQEISGLEVGAGGRVRGAITPAGSGRCRPTGRRPGWGAGGVSGTRLRQFRRAALKPERPSADKAR